MLDSSQGTGLSNAADTFIVDVQKKLAQEVSHQDSCLRSRMTSRLESCPDNQECVWKYRNCTYPDLIWGSKPQSCPNTVPKVPRRT